MNLTLWQVLQVIARIVPALQAANVIDPSGKFMANVASYENAVRIVEAELKSFMTVPAEVDLVINAIPAVLSLLGVK